jgi:insertion element IS1 protein InsB
MLLAPPRSRTNRALPGRAAEVDEMRSFVGTKEQARWLWHAIDHHTGRVLAYVVGTRKDIVCLKLRAVLTPFRITRYYSDTARVSQRLLPPAQHTGGQLSLQQIERMPLMLRTRHKR